MERLKRGLSFRKKKNHVPESSKPHQWQEDERKVRDGTCSFQVRYLGCIEVFESRGIQVCEEAVKALKSKQSRSIWSRMSMRKKKRDKENQAQEVDNEANEEGGKQCKGKYQRAILYVSGDALRVVDEISKGLIVDQTIEKVSFCAPDRHQEKGFAYICRDGTTRRWMCHGFLAMKESGERLSHAVGCAFAICLERKQKREKESVQVTFNDNMTSFTRTGSFRQTTLTERLADPQVAIVAEPVPVREAVNPHAVQRPHATDAMLERQSSFRGFNKLAESSPFKRQMSLRLNELPSTLDRQKQLGINGPHNGFSNGAVSTVTSIPEASPTKEQEESISEMCQQLTQGLSALTTTEDPFASAPQNAGFNNPGLNTHTTAKMANPAFSQNIPAAGPVHQTNPWSSPAAPYSAGPTTASRVSDAEFWLHSTATSIAASSSPGPSTMPQQQPPQLSAHQPLNGHHQVPTSIPPHHPQATTQWQQQQHQQQQQQQHQQQQFAASILHQRAPHLAQIRSHSLDTPPSWQQQAAAQHFQPPRQPPATAPGPPPTPPQHQPAATFDPFDAAWAAKGKQAKNPFQPGDSVTKTFEVNL